MKNLLNVHFHSASLLGELQHARKVKMEQFKLFKIVVTWFFAFTELAFKILSLMKEKNGIPLKNSSLKK